MALKDLVVARGDGEGAAATPYLWHGNDAGEWVVFFDDEDVVATPYLWHGIDTGEWVAFFDDEDVVATPYLWHGKDAGEWARFSTTRRRRHTLSVAWQDLEVVQDDDVRRRYPLSVALQDGE